MKTFFRFVLPLFALHGLAHAADVELPAIVVQSAPAEGSAAEGYRVNRVGLGPLGDNAAQDTPFSIQAVPADLMRNTQAGNTTEALKYVPTVYANTGGSQITPYFTLRGFSASTWTYNMALDGMRSFDIWQPLEDKERIEILNGANSFLYGVTSPAGMFHYVLKRPVFTPMAEITLGANDRQLYAHADLGGPIAGRSDIAYRLNLGYGNAGETGINKMSQERYVFSGAVAWKIGADTLLDVDLSSARRDVDRPQALFVPNAASGIPKAPDGDDNFGPPDGKALDITRRVGIRLESRLNEVFTARAQLRYTHDERSYRMGRQTLQNANLDYRWRLDGQKQHDRDARQFNVFLDANFTTAFLRHKLTIGGSRDVFEEAYNGQQSQTFPGVYPGNLDSGHPDIPTLAPARINEATQKTTYTTWTLADQIHWGEQWALLLGGALARVDDKVSSRTPAGAVSVTPYDKQAFTPTVALSFKPIPAVTTYVSYTKALQQGGVSGSSGNFGEVFAPSVGRQKEIGVKATLGEMNLALSYFDIEQENLMVENDITRPNGRNAHRGWEFSLSGKPIKHLTLMGGFTLLDAEVDKAASNIGKTPQGVPEKMASLYAEYELPFAPGLAINGGISYTGKVPVDAANTLYVKAVTIGDIGLRYQHKIHGKDTTWRFNIANVGDKAYWATRSGMLYPGNPRVVSLSATLAF